jgi:carboxymethylenebutenolidase
MTDITIHAPDGGSFTGYLAVPKSGVGYYGVGIQELLGEAKNIRKPALRNSCDAT